MRRPNTILLLLGLAASAGWHGAGAQGGASAAQTAAAGRVNSEGAMGGVNLRRSGVHMTKGVSRPNGVVWKSEVLCRPEEGNFYFAPAVVGGTAYVVCGGSRERLTSGDWPNLVHDEGVYAVDAATGRKVWEFKPKRFELSDIAVAGGLVYVGSRSDYFGGPAGTLYALDAATGRERWSYKSKKHRLDHASPAVFDGTLYFDGPGGDLHALDAATGQARWVFNTKGRPTAAAISDGTIYLGSSSGLAYALDAATGRQKWEGKAGAGIGDPVVAGGLLYFAAADGKLYALDAATGERVLGVKPPGRMGSFFAVADGTIYYAGAGEDFYAADARTAREKWRLKTGAYCDAPVVADGLVYFPCEDGTLYAADALTGQVRWSIGSKTLWYNTPFISDGTAYFLMSDGRMYAVR